MNDVYAALARHLDDLPAGFPPTDTGVELRILRRLFTPDEAAIALALTMMPEPVEAIAQRLDRPASQLAPQLAQMARKGLTVHAGKDGVDLYMAAQFMIGIWEYHVKDLDKELIRDFNAYVPYLMNTVLTTRTKQLRIIPVSKTVTADMRVMAYEDAAAIIRSQSKIAVAPCICRTEHAMVGKGCDKPRENCMVFAGGAYYYVENNLGRFISQEEALEILDEAVEAGLVLQPGNSQRPFNICMCCGCCCQMLKNMRALPAPAKAVNSSYFAVVDLEACTACGVCAERCPMDAIAVDEHAQVDLERCIGCGVCAAGCDYEAIVLSAKAEGERWVPPASTVETYINIARERGKL